MGDEEGENRGQGRREKSLFWFSRVMAGQTVQRNEWQVGCSFQIAVPQKGSGEAGGTGCRHPLGGSRLAGAQKRILQVLQRGEDLGTHWMARVRPTELQGPGTGLSSWRFVIADVRLYCD